MTDSSTQASKWGAAVIRLAERLGDPDVLFTAAEVDFLRAAAEAYGRSESGSAVTWRAGWDAGYRAAHAELEKGYPPAPYGLVQTDEVAARPAVRAAADADRRQRYAGGPVPVWDADRPDLPGLGTRGWRAGT